MRYIAIRMKSRDTYVQHLEKLSNEGGRVISAGMAENSTCSCYEWWAIVEKQNEAQQTPEAPKGETAELLEAARKIKKECEKRRMCEEYGGCPFEMEDGKCLVSTTTNRDYTPDRWPI